MLWITAKREIGWFENTIENEVSKQQPEKILIKKKK